MCLEAVLAAHLIVIVVAKLTSWSPLQRIKTNSPNSLGLVLLQRWPTQKARVTHQKDRPSFSVGQVGQVGLGLRGRDDLKSETNLTNWKSLGHTSKKIDSHFQLVRLVRLVRLVSVYGEETIWKARPTWPTLLYEKDIFILQTASVQTASKSVGQVGLGLLQEDQLKTETNLTNWKSLGHPSKR